ncbi:MULTISPECIES: FkbM family methyltransferase [Enterobacteriaceae]
MDDFNFENVCFVKIDVEGMENKVLDGAVETFRKSMPVIQIEILKSDIKEIYEKVKFISEEYIICRYGQYDILYLSNEKITAYGMDSYNLEVIHL